MKRLIPYSMMATLAVLVGLLVLVLHTVLPAIKAARAKKKAQAE